MSVEYVVARVGDLPEGSHKIVEAGGRKLGLFNVRGRYYAISNACIHQNGPLCLGAVSGTVASSAETGWERAWVRQGEIIVCPWHSMEFDITTGRSVAHPKRRVSTYHVNVVGEEIKVAIS